MVNTEKDLVSGDEVLGYIPQRPPVVMVDTFYGWKGDKAKCGYTVTGQCPFCRDGVLDERALIENMAQSAALSLGYRRRAEGLSISPGYLGAVSGFMVFRAIRAGERLCTVLDFAVDMVTMAVAEAEVYVGDELVCRSRFKMINEIE